MEHPDSRRAFLGAGLRALGALPLLSAARHLAAQGQPPRVVVARDPRCIDGRNRCDPARVDRLFHQALLALTGAKEAREAWRLLGVTPQDTVAVKLNCNTWVIALHPHQELVEALVGSLALVVPRERIILYERETRDLKAAGYTPNRGGPGVQVYGNEQGGGYDEQEGLTRILTRTATRIINLASLKCVEFGDYGASLFMKNHVGSLRDEDMPKCHGNPAFLAELNARPSIRTKTVLNLCDALRGSYRRAVPWYPQSLVLGRDPVAAEAAALDLINAKRRAEGLAPLPDPVYLKLAQEVHRLGTRAPGEVLKLDA